MFNYQKYDLYRYVQLETNNRKKIVKNNFSHFFFENYLSLKKKLNPTVISKITYFKKLLNLKSIDCFFLIIKNNQVVHTSIINFKKNNLYYDKFFYKFSAAKYAVIGPTLTNKKFRKMGYYKIALDIQAKYICKIKNIKNIYISTRYHRSNNNFFFENSFTKFGEGLVLSFFNKIHIYYIFKKRINVFYNNTLILKYSFVHH